MSNACRNSLLIIVAVIVCVATPLLGSKVFAQSELLFPVARSVSYTAPNLEGVFEKMPAPTTVVQDISIIAPEAEVVFVGHPQVTAPVTRSNKVVKNLAVATETAVYIEEVSAEETFVVQSELRFPVVSKVSYHAPDLETVFADYQPNPEMVVTKVTSYIAPDLEIVFAGHPIVDDITVVKEVVSKKDQNRARKTRKQDTVARNIASLQKQVAALQQQIASLTGDTANDFGYGSCGPTVKDLQKFLNRNGFTLATTGAGSAGQETSFFGPRTLAALKQFQSAYNIPTTGVVDAQTRNLINSIEYNVFGKITATDCAPSKNTVTAKDGSNKKDQKEVIRNDQTDKDGDKSTSGNFFTNLFKKIVNFFLSLFNWN